MKSENVDDIEAEAIFVNDAVNALVATAADGFTRFFSRTAIAHFYKYIDDEALEESRGHSLTNFKSSQPKDLHEVSGTQSAEARRVFAGFLSRRFLLFLPVLGALL